MDTPKLPPGFDWEPETTSFDDSSPPLPDRKPVDLSSPAKLPDGFKWETEAPSLPEPSTPATPAAKIAEPKLPEGFKFDDPADEKGFGQWVADGLTDPLEYVEGVKGIPGGGVGIVGTAMKGVPAYDAANSFKRQIFGKYKDVMAKLPNMSDADVESLKQSARDDGSYLNLMMGVAIDNVRSGKWTPEQWAKLYAPTDIQDYSIYKAGKEVSDFGRELLPAAKGYEESGGRMVGEGLGSLIAAIPISLIGGPVGGGALFSAAGSGEAIENAIAFDKAEKAAGRKGLTQEQIQMAGVYGIAPGATDILAIEALLGRLKLPGIEAIKKPLAKSIARIGGQTFIEGFQEGGQQFLQNLIAQEVYNPDQDLTEGVVPNTAVGGGVGGIAATGKEVAEGLLRNFAGRRSHHTANPPTPPPIPPAPQDTAGVPTPPPLPQAPAQSAPVPPPLPKTPDDVALLRGAWMAS